MRVSIGLAPTLPLKMGFGLQVPTSSSSLPPEKHFHILKSLA